MSATKKTAVAAALSETKNVTIKAPNFVIADFMIVGTAPFVQHKFSQKAREQIIATQKAW